ncbi:DotD/TraH family lipoprotein [Stenotrophomonas maltophilia]|uniref:DotD/TraH family lipoprotein n=1 Tax=Stenotrophomonas maltophilia TaxID=40324 RepID=UPI0013DB0F03|nr:DotD/TraH family lipoprotein [Stenotrophomonas maltophilia]
MRRYYAVFLAACAVLSAGCATTRSAGSPAPDAAQQNLTAAASAIQQSLRDLSEAEQYDKMRTAPGTPRLRVQIPGLERMVTMPWNGPLEPAVMRLAAEGSYEFKLLGRQPAVGIVVQIGPEPATIADHLRNLGIQAGTRADIAIEPATAGRKGIVAIEYSNGGL